MSIPQQDTELQIITRDEAIAAGSTIYFTGKPCKRGHLSKRFVAGHACAQCNRERPSTKTCLTRWVQNNRSRSNEIKTKWKANHPEQNARINENYWARPEIKLQNGASKKAWYARDTDRIRPKQNTRHSIRRAAKIQSTPKWLDELAVRTIYEDCLVKSRETGIEHEVDHIIPLVGKIVCGLHVQSNLRIVPKVENRKKGSKLYQEVLESLDYTNVAVLVPSRHQTLPWLRKMNLIVKDTVK